MSNNNSLWPEVRLGELLTYIDPLIELDDETEYTTITVKRRHGGLEARENLLGSQIRTKKQYKLVPGAFIISRVQCWHQAYAIVPDTINPNIIASTNYDQFVISPEIDKRFFWWLSYSPRFTEIVRSCAFGVVIEKMVFNRNAWLEKTISFPPLEEQQRIVARIEELVAKIEEAHELRREVEEEAEALTKSKLATIFNTLAGKYGKHKLNSLLLEAGYGTSIKCSQDRVEGSVPVLRIPNVASEQVNLHDLKYGILSDNELERLHIAKGDLLIVRTNGSADLVGRCAVSPLLPERTVFASYIIRLRCDSSVISPDYLQLMLRYLRTGGQLIDFARTTAGQYNVSLGRLGAVEVPIPPISEQQCIVAFFNDLQSKVDILQRKQAEISEELDALLPSILDRAFKGEL